MTIHDIFKEILLKIKQTKKGSGKDAEKIIKTSLPDKNKTRNRYSGDEEEVSGTYWARFGHLSRTCRA